MKNLKLGLVKGRHELPVEKYIFENIENVLDFETLEKEAYTFLKENLINHGKSVIIYVTGLTSALIACLKALKQLKMECVSLMHYDASSENYKEQIYFL